MHICLIFITGVRSISLFIQRGVGGGGRETERKATITDKLAINLNNGVKGHKS